MAVTLWRIPFSDLRTAFRGLTLESLLPGIFSVFVLVVLRAYKWHCMLTAAGKFRLQQSLRTLFGGFSLGLITPGRIGELGRCLFVRKDERTQVALLTFLDRSLDFWALLTLVGASLFLLVAHPAAIFGVALWIALFPMVLGLPGLLAHLSLVAHRSRHLNGQLNEVASALPPLQMLKFAIMSLGAMWVELSAFFLLLRAFSPDEPHQCRGHLPLHRAGRRSANFLQRSWRARRRGRHSSLVVLRAARRGGGSGDALVSLRSSSPGCPRADVVRLGKDEKRFPSCRLSGDGTGTGSVSPANFLSPYNVNSPSFLVNEEAAHACRASCLIRSSPVQIAGCRISNAWILRTVWPQFEDSHRMCYIGDTAGALGNL